MNIEERIEKAGDAVRLVMQRGGQYSYTEVARASIAAAFPELFDGTGWIAPTEPSGSMLTAAHLAVRDDLEPTLDELDAFYAAMRDAHLAPSIKSGEENDDDPPPHYREVRGILKTP